MPIRYLTGVNIDSNTLFVDSTNNRVGIGTGSPAQTFHVAGNGRFEGNVGIGHGSASEYFLEIGQGRTGNGFAYIDFIGDATYTDYGLRIIRFSVGANAPSSIAHRGLGDFTINTEEAAPIAFLTTNSERMRIASNGNVGIGTTSPSYKLDVNGATQIQNELILSTNDAAFRLYRTTGVNYFDWSSGQDLRFSTVTSIGGAGRSSAVTFLSTGNVGIGTTSPTFKLDVSGEGRFTSAITGQQGLSISGYGALSNSANKFVLDFYNGNSRLYSMGANASTKGGFEFHTNSSDGSLDVIALGISSTGAATFSSSVTASSLIKSGGTASQYLMADGSVSTLTNPVTGTGTTNYVTKWTSGSAIGDSALQEVSGNLGLGVTPSAWNTVTAFQVGSTSLGGYSNTGYLNSNAFYQSGWKYINSSYSARYEINASDAGEHRWFTAPSGTAGNAISFTQAMTLTAAGNVGIGTTSPAEKLSVNGGVYVASFVGTTTPYITVGTAASGADTRFEIVYNAAGNYGSLGISGYDGIFTVKPNAIGIGTTAPNAKLNVNTDAMGVTVSDASGISLTNTTAAASGAQQMSPTLKWSGQGWKTTAPAASQNVSFISFLTPVQGSTAPSGILNFASSINGGAYSTRMSLTSAGALSISAGLTATTGVFSSTVTNTIANLTTTPTDGVVIVTPTAATSVIPVRISPRLRISGTAWNTGGTPASNTMNWTIDNLPTSGNPPTSALRFNFDRDGGGYSTLVNFISNGNVGIGSTGPASLVHIDRSSSSNNITGTPSIIISNRNSTSGTFIGGGIFNNAYRDISDSSITAGVWFENQNSTDAGALAKQSAIIFGAQSYATGYNTPSERMRITAAGDVGIGNTAPSQKLHVTGNIRVTGAYYDSNNEAGSSGQVLSSTGTGTDWITPVTTTATSLYDLLPAARVAYNWVGQVVNDTWTTVFSKSSNLLTAGTWMVKMYVSDFATGGGHYTYTYSGMFTWYQDTTNQGGEQAASEIYLHRMGHAANASVLYLRTTETTAASSGDGLFQIKGNYSNTANQTIQFQFVKIF